MGDVGGRRCADQNARPIKASDASDPERRVRPGRHCGTPAGGGPEAGRNGSRGYGATHIHVLVDASTSAINHGEGAHHAR